MNWLEEVHDGVENFTLVGVSFVMPQLAVPSGAFSDFLTISIQVLTMIYLFLKILAGGNNSTKRDGADSD